MHFATHVRTTNRPFRAPQCPQGSPSACVATDEPQRRVASARRVRPRTLALALDDEAVQRFAERGEGTLRAVMTDGQRELRLYVAPYFAWISVTAVVAVAAKLRDAFLLHRERDLEMVAGHGFVEGERGHLPARARLGLVEVHEERSRP